MTTSFASILLFLTALCWSPASCFAAEAAAGDKGPLPVFLCAGQSNMVGKRSSVKDLPDALKKAGPNMAFYDGAWVPLAPGATQNPDSKKTSGYGPEISFAFQMAQTLKQPVGIIKCSVGGTNIAKDWKPDEKVNPKQVKAGLYAQLMNLVKAAGEQREIVVLGVIWMQGESDSTRSENAQAYGTNYPALITRLRKDLGNPRLPFVSGRVNPPVGKKFAKENVDLVRAAIETCPVKDYAWVDLDDLPKVSDNLHYSSEGIITMGQRMAEKMAELLKDQ